ncbi:hypothetical protein JAAARDRAFT_194195 [Jaapia argillacea MUCL 33604]|uniref:Uncharacterized protein n=1 Tax=Jaapia argillacea MUCL 33604 TaxID=933084 RepID=A0A067PQB4_9AGAM|nr:hypothetical protein JAAARDRAFT_194195 [Jaapia argillacea MUCL 33604]
MGENTARLLSAHVDNRCLNTEINDIFGNPGANAKENCHVAKRPLPCSTCLPFCLQQPRNSGPASLTKLERDQVHAKLREFARNRWSLKTTAFARNTPASVLWTGKTLETLLAAFHLLRSRESLDHILSEWSHINDDGDALYKLIDELNQRLDRRRAKAKIKKNEKSAATRARNREAKATNPQTTGSQRELAKAVGESSIQSTNRVTTHSTGPSFEDRENYPPPISSLAPQSYLQSHLAPPTQQGGSEVIAFDRYPQHPPPTTTLIPPGTVMPSSAFIVPQTFALPPSTAFRTPHPHEITHAYQHPSRNMLNHSFGESGSYNTTLHSQNSPQTPLARFIHPTSHYNSYLDSVHSLSSQHNYGSHPPWPAVASPALPVPQHLQDITMSSSSNLKRSADTEFTTPQSRKRPRNH